MFDWFVAFLIFSTAETLWVLYLDYRQYRHLVLHGGQVPGVLKDEVEEDEVKKAAAYSLDKLRFGMVKSVFGFGIGMLVYLNSWLPLFWRLADAINFAYLGSHSEYYQCLIFGAILFIPSKIMSLPFNLYYDFVLEERHGFNKKTLKLFIMDELKGLLILIVIGVPITWVTIWNIMWGGRKFYLSLWVIFTVIAISFITIYPDFIAPLFNKYEPLQDEQLKKKIDDLAATVKYPLKKIYQVDHSLRSAHSNAYLYGFWRSKRLVLYDTLLETTHERILAIVGHELGHWKLSHTIKNMIFGLSHTYLMLYLFGFVLYSDQVYRAFGFNDLKPNRPITIGLMLFANIYEPISLVMEMLMTCLSRRFEFQADAFAAELGMSSDLQGGLVELHRKNLSSFAVDPWYAWFHYSHPKLVERLEALRARGKKEE